MSVCAPTPGLDTCRRWWGVQPGTAGMSDSTMQCHWLLWDCMQPRVQSTATLHAGQRAARQAWACVHRLPALPTLCLGPACAQRLAVELDPGVAQQRAGVWPLLRVLVEALQQQILQHRQELL